MPKDTKTLGNSKARACESLGFVHKKGCARVLTQPHFIYTIKIFVCYLLFSTTSRKLFQKIYQEETHYHQYYSLNNILIGQNITFN